MQRARAGPHLQVRNARERKQNTSGINAGSDAYQ